MAKWVLSPVAEAELTEILDYVAEQSGSLAVVEGVHLDFKKAFDTLADSPGIGSERRVAGSGSWGRSAARPDAHRMAH